MTDILDQARAIINAPQNYEDPEAALAALEKAAAPEDRFMFPMLWEGLATALEAHSK
jgi:hypothetical protein